MDVHNLKCLIQEIVYKRAYHSQYGMECKTISPCLYINMLLAIESGCPIPEKLQCEIDKLERTIRNYPVTDTSTIECNIEVVIQLLPPLTPIIVEIELI